MLTLWRKANCISPLFRVSYHCAPFSGIPPCFDLPWCHSVLTDPAYTKIPIPTRAPKPSTQSSFFGRVLNTPDTISHCVAVYRAPAHGLHGTHETHEAPGALAVLEASGPHGTRVTHGAHETHGTHAHVNELRMLMHLGSGVNGHAHIAHGGFVVVLLDEAMGMVNTLLKNEPVLSANLNTNFKVPLATPTVVLVRAWITKAEGRKRWTSGTVEDGSGLVYATADGLFLEFKKSQK
eukprot:Phypoly_transcript_15255.p1 GENE.Phypoly_transcript_15255~~Phypoly_transcript_15255.p1  ORF type:complete len:236 (-),score=34.57 Phypoly_transcript_15255:169-876(-)